MTSTLNTWVPALSRSPSTTASPLIQGERECHMRRTFQLTPMKEAVLITSGDLRESANQACWPAQKMLEELDRTASHAKESSYGAPFPLMR